METPRSSPQALAVVSGSGQSTSAAPLSHPLFSELLFATRDLARLHLRTVADFWDGHTLALCEECHRTAEPDAAMVHGRLCSTGRVVRLLAAITGLPEVVISNERSHGSGFALEPSNAVAERQPRLGDRLDDFISNALQKLPATPGAIEIGGAQ